MQKSTAIIKAWIDPELKREFKIATLINKSDMTSALRDLIAEYVLETKGAKK